MEHIREKPKWLKVKAPISKGYKETAAIVNSNNLVTVCKEAACPNIGECWEKAHASFMMLGDTCTRSCAFCNIKTGKPGPVDFLEPERIADAVYQMKLLHVVITSVDRDDLEDGGAKQFYNVIKAIRRKTNKTTVEILTPDFQRKKNAIDIIIKAKPDVFNHNLETVPRLYKTVRKGARYFHSLNLLHSVKEKEPKIFTKSGIMVGLGETKEEVYQVMDDLRSANVDFITIGQYLRPTAKHHPVVKYITPSEFKEYKQMAYGKGFLMVSSSPFTRSSYHADDDFKIMQEKRNKAYA